MGITANSLGVPGIGISKQISFGQVSADGNLTYRPAGGRVAQAKGYDAYNADDLRTIRIGTLMAQHPTNLDWAPWVIGVTSGAIANGATSLTIPAASAVELARRVGATGNLQLTAPPAAAGVVRVQTLAYSAINTTTGVVTITSAAANQVEQISFNAASTAGNLQLYVQMTNGTYATTGNIAWNATDATYIAAMNAALDAATGVVGGIVASAIPATATAFGLRLTYSGTGYAGLAWVSAKVFTYPTSSTSAVYTPVTVPVDGRMASGAVVSEANYDLPKSFVGGDNPILMYPAGDTNWPRIPSAGFIQNSKLLNLPTDVSFRLYVQQNLSTLVGNKFIFM